MLTGEEIENWEQSESYYDPYYRQPLNRVQRVSAMVEDFAKVTQQEASPETYKALIFEECKEWLDEILVREIDPEKELKELADIVYVVFGYARAKGWDLEVAIQRVHNNNLERIIQPDGSIKFREDGKVLKRDNAPKVNLKDLVWKNTHSDQ